MALVMTVEPGFGGQKFMEDMMPKVWVCKCVFATSILIYNPQTTISNIEDACVSLQVSWLRSQFPSLDIEVDGGVGPDSIHRCAEVHKSLTFLIYLYECKSKKILIFACYFNNPRLEQT